MSSQGTLDVTPVHENGRGQSCPRGRPATSRQGPHGQNPARATKVPDESGSVSCKRMHLLLWLQERTEMHKEEQCEEEAMIPRPTKARTPLRPAPSAYVPPPSLPPCPGERLKGMLKEIKPRRGRNRREDPQGCLLNLLLQSQSPSLKRPLQKRDRRYLKRKREKLMLARRGITLQKIEMPKQTRHGKLKVLEMPSKVCAFLITVYFW
ncbi:putative Dresden prostate carcinoma protein 2 isoform X1 [Chlorocebus sabaeus]|uniref:Uncharacterized protein n=1 Tax=Chlorocebus sabaeus TaxID=60711 RepID=A0A0D9RD44_CHLSB|nr:putative Dresden prostate carcinoma protein 2 isoform X1 [Chlorocebus sabaeus]